MRINRAIGMGIGILVLAWLLPAVLGGLEASLLKFFDAASRVFDASGVVIDRAGL